MIWIRDGVLGCTAAVLAFVASCGADAKDKEKILYAFMGGSDGAGPLAGLTADAHGDLYGATNFGGSKRCRKQGCGTIFEVTPGGAETVLHSFKDGGDGSAPYAGLILDAQNNLYGTTSAGGGSGCYDKGCGTVYELPSGGGETIRHSFTGADGSFPRAVLIMDARGNLYGTTADGGTSGYGTVFKLTAKGTETVLHSFSLGNDGGYPSSGLIADLSGNLYGTTYIGGSSHLGTIFEVTQEGAETVLYSFCGQADCVDGAYPDASLIADAQGNLYGTTLEGGSQNFGTVFRVSSQTGAEIVLYSFTGAGDGGLPTAGLIADSRGNFYGTTQHGGASGYGTVFKVTPKGSETVLHSFAAGNDGAYPYAGLIADSRGDLYGTTYAGGASGLGTVFEIEK